MEFYKVNTAMGEGYAREFFGQTYLAVDVSPHNAKEKTIYVYKVVGGWTDMRNWKYLHEWNDMDRAKTQINRIERHQAQLNWEAAECTGPFKLSQAAYCDVHPDYRSDKPDRPSMLTYQPKFGTVLVQVEFTDNVPAS